MFEYRLIPSWKIYLSGLKSKSTNPNFKLELILLEKIETSRSVLHLQVLVGLNSSSVEMHWLQKMVL